MHSFPNPHRHTGFPDLSDIPAPSVDATSVATLLARCPHHGSTPLVEVPALARTASVAEVWVKDERGRMGLGSFKALGAAYVIAHLAQGPQGVAVQTFVTASAGNHGLSVAAGAQAFGAKAVVYIAETVPEDFAIRLRDIGAEVVRHGTDYEASMTAAEKAAEDHGWTLLSDSSWPGYTELPHRLMEGYLQMAAEIADEIPQPPTHVFLQAGVGGMAAAVAAYLRHVWGDVPRIIIVEPEAAPALMESIRADRAVETSGPVSNMGRLDCKTPSLIALKGLARDADVFVTLSDEEVTGGLKSLREAGLDTSPSGGAGLVAALITGDDPHLQLTPSSRVLAIVTEGPDA